MFGTLCASWTWMSIPFQVREVFSYYVFNYVLCPILTLFFFFWDSYSVNNSMLGVVTQVS